MGSMEFLTSKDIGPAVTAVLSHALRVRIASAFFCPGTATLVLLNGVKNLTLVISEEFTINDPAKLERLRTATKRSVPPDSKGGKLHAKVFLADLPDGSSWALIGSANLTEQGLFFNEEACIALSSSEPKDKTVIREVQDWFAALLARSRPVDILQAKAIWATRAKQKRMPKVTASEEAPGYYAIKTTSGGSNSMEHWPMFEKDSVVAIGWEDIEGDPSRLNEKSFRKLIRRTYPHYKHRSEDFAFNTFRDFIDMPVGSIVMVCRGYAPNQVNTHVHIYAFARVIGPFRVDVAGAKEWKFKRPVVLQQIHKTLTARVMAKLLKKGSLRQTMHTLNKEAVESVAAELGVQIEV